VDDPARALIEVDRLIGEGMTAEGYPVRDFDQQAADIPVDHPTVVENYSEGHIIALNNVQGRATTEDLRKAMIHYGALFQELVSQAEYAPAEDKTVTDKILRGDDLLSRDVHDREVVKGQEAMTAVPVVATNPNTANNPNPNTTNNPNIAASPSYTGTSIGAAVATAGAREQEPNA
jgi:hypothetical protein